jgi:GTP:adenosylcobinamide-phosphate guanylyltransferase
MTMVDDREALVGREPGGESRAFAPIPAVVTAGDLRAAKAIRGESKIYLEIEGRPLVAHVVEALQRVPEVSEVWVVGDAERLRAVFSREESRRELRKPLHIVDQFRNLYENAWQTYRRLLPGAGPEGRDPEGAELDVQVLYASADLPFVTPQEISQFIRRSADLGCDYALGVVKEESMEAFYPTPSGGDGIRMAYFNLREARVRQSNLHLVRPARVINRHYIEEMYEHRHQRQLGSIIALAWRLLRSEQGGIRVLAYFCAMHLAGFINRRGWRRLADRIRSWVPVARVEAACSSLLRVSCRLVVTDFGGAAVDIDNEHDYDVARLRYSEWTKAQREKAERLYGPLPLPPGEQTPPS